MVYANQLGALTVGLSCVPGSEVERRAKIAITPAVGPEVITGSTRMRAGTATKLVLNMLSTGAMIRTGMVYGNLMVNVQPTNEKLKDRAIRIIAAATGVDEDQAAALLDAGRSGAGGDRDAEAGDYAGAGRAAAGRSSRAAARGSGRGRRSRLRGRLASIKSMAAGRRIIACRDGMGGEAVGKGLAKLLILLALVPVPALPLLAQIERPARPGLWADRYQLLRPRRRTRL